MCLRMGKTGFFRTGHRMTADKTSVKTHFLCGAVDVCLHTSDICQNAVRRDNIFQNAQGRNVGIDRCAEKNAVTRCKLWVRDRGAADIDRMLGKRKAGGG